MIPREILISEQQIQARVAEMAAEIRRDFPDEVHLVAVLKGAFIFLSDLVRHIPGKVSLDFVDVQLRQGHHDLRRGQADERPRSDPRRTQRHYRRRHRRLGPDAALPARHTPRAEPEVAADRVSPEQAVATQD